MFLVSEGCKKNFFEITTRDVYITNCFPHGEVVKKALANARAKETWVQSLGWEDPLEKGMTTHSIILAWKIPWTEEPGRL